MATTALPPLLKGKGSWITRVALYMVISSAVYHVGGESIGANFNAYPNISRWLGQMKALRSWQSVNAVFYQYMVDPNKGKSFVGL